MIPECYKYWVEDNELQIPTKEFNNFKEALDYAKDGLVTFVHEVPCTAGDCCDDEDEIVWSWDDTWNDDEACAAVAKRHPDFCPDCGRNQELCECGKFKDQDLFLNLEEDADFDDEYELFLDTEDTPVENKTCPECGTRLTDGGYCPVCDDGEEDMTDEEFAEALYEAKKAKKQELDADELLNGKYDEDEAKAIRSRFTAADLEKDFFDMQKKNLKEALDPDIVVDECEVNTPDEYIASVYRKSDRATDCYIKLEFNDIIKDHLDFTFYKDREFEGEWNGYDYYSPEGVYYKKLSCNIDNPENCNDAKITYYIDPNDEVGVSKEEFKKVLNITDADISEILKKILADLLEEIDEELQDNPESFGLRPWDYVD